MKQVDFIIVGQGIAGTLLAHDLDDRRQSLAIIDVPLPASSSRVAAGLINPFGMRRCTPSENATIYQPFAFERFRTFEKKLNQSFFFPLPIIKLFANDQQRHQWQVKQSNTNMDRYITRFVDKHTFSSFHDHFGSAEVGPSAHLNVNKWLDSSRRYFARTHHVIEEQFDFSKFDVDLQTYKGISAKYVIFCEGFRVMNNPFFKHLPLSPTKGEVMTIKIPSIANFERIISKGVYIIPKGNHYYYVGATYTHHDFTDRLTDHAKQFLLNQLKGILSVDFEITSQKAGVRPTVKHRKPLFGLHTSYTKIGVFNGLGTRGLLQGPYLSAKFSEELLRDTKNIKL